jgi:hypothetical protein
MKGNVKSEKGEVKSGAVSSQQFTMACSHFVPLCLLPFASQSAS